MSFRELIKLSTRTFRTRPGRTILTILGISIGIGAILVFVSLGYGLQKTMLEQITTAESLLSLDVTTPKIDIISLSEEKVNEISNIPNVEEVSPLALVPGQINFGNLTSDTFFFACKPSFFRLGGILAQDGEFFEDENEYKIVLSSALMRSFNIEPEKAIGNKIKIKLFKIQSNDVGEETVEIVEKEEFYEIVGVAAEEITSFAYIPIGTLADMEITEYSQVKVKVASLKVMDAVREEIIGMGYLVSALSETVDEANKIFRAIQIVLAAFGLVALLVAAIGMANTMTVTLLERTNEIGVMKAIGASDKDVGRMFLAESIIMGFLGGAGGVGLGFLISELFNWGINMLAKGLGGQGIDLFFSPVWFIVFIIVFSTLVGFLSGVLPARRASKMNPLQALRYK